MGPSSEISFCHNIYHIKPSGKFVSVVDKLICALEIKFYIYQTLEKVNFYRPFQLKVVKSCKLEHLILHYWLFRKRKPRNALKLERPSMDSFNPLQTSEKIDR